MAKKEFTFRGKTIEEVKKLDTKEFLNLLPARSRRSVKRGLTEEQKKLMIKIKRTNEGSYKKTIKTHCRNMIVLPEMLDLKILVHSGRKFEAVVILPEMLGHYLGEFVATRQRVQHSSPGIGATRSSASQSVK